MPEVHIFQEGHTNLRKKMFWILFATYELLKVSYPIFSAKGQLISERIYKVIVSPKIWTKICQDFCPRYHFENWIEHQTHQSHNSTYYSINVQISNIYRNIFCQTEGWGCPMQSWRPPPLIFKSWQKTGSNFFYKSTLVPTILNMWKAPIIRLKLLYILVFHKMSCVHTA